jgi:glutamyl-tRNA synthetase
MSKRLGHLSLQALRAEGLEPLAVASAAVLVGTAEAVKPAQSLDALASKIDFARISHSPARFDPDDLVSLTARTLHAMSFESAAPRLEKLDVGGGRAFWEAVRGNLSRFDEANLWWRVTSEAISPALSVADLEICKSAAAALPPKPWNEVTWEKANWDAFVETMKRTTGKSGRALFHPLRIALTGEERGPELRALLPFIGRVRAAARLQGEQA